MKPMAKFDMVSRTLIVRSEKPNKPLTALASNNSHQMDRIVGFAPDGQPVVVAKRSGKAGVEFTKLQSGKVFAVAADACSPVMEKDEAGKSTKTQKTEDGAKLFSASGFYLLSSKEYPAVDIDTRYVHLSDATGEMALTVSDAQIASMKHIRVTSDMDLDILASALEADLGDEHNPLTRFVEGANRARKRTIDTAKAEAEDADETYGGVEFKELPLSNKDGNPFLMLRIVLSEDKVLQASVLREAVTEKDDKRIREYFTAEQAMERFMQSPTWTKLAQWVEAGNSADVMVVQGTAMRTSVMFRNKVLAQKTTPKATGDGPFIRGASEGWVKAVMTTMFSRHPAFPQQDYDSLHFVAALRQAEMGMNKKADGGFELPQPILYSISSVMQPSKELAAA